MLDGVPDRGIARRYAPGLVQVRGRGARGDVQPNTVHHPAALASAPVAKPVEFHQIKSVEFDGIKSAPVAGEAQRAVAYEMYNTKTGHAIVDYSRHTYVGHLSEEAGYEARPLVYAAPQASEAVRDAGDVALPLFPKGHARNSDVHPDSYAYDKWQLADYARAAILADRQRGADPVIGHITVKGKGRSSVDLYASHADLPEGEYVIRAALSAQPGAQREQRDEN